MTGKILHYDIENSTGTISGDDGKRYKFSKSDWKEDTAPQKGIQVDIDIEEDGRATDIYKIDATNIFTQNNEMMMGLLAIGITFFFGFIGTFVTRLVLAKQPIAKTIMPTFIHFVITVLLIVPLAGWIIYFIGTGYYMYKNYQLVVNDGHSLKNKYE